MKSLNSHYRFKNPLDHIPILRQLRLSAFLLILFTTFITGLLVSHFSYRTYVYQLEKLQSMRTKYAASQINAYIDDLKRKMQYVSRITGLSQMSREYKKSVLDALVRHNSAYEEIAILDPQGKIEIMEQPYNLREHTPFQVDTLAFRNAFYSGEDYIGTVRIDPVTHNPFVSFAVPIRDYHDKIGGVLMATINLKFLWVIVSQIQIGKTGYAYVIDYQNNIIAMKGLPEAQTRLLNLSDRTDIELMHSPTMSEYKGLFGKKVVGSSEMIPSTHWYAIVEIPKSEAYEYFLRVLINMMIALFIAIIIGIGLTVHTSKLILRPLSVLTVAAHKIREKDFQIQVDLPETNEFGMLASAFREMTANLNQHFEDMQTRLDYERMVSNIANQFTSVQPPYFLDLVGETVGVIGDKTHLNRIFVRFLNCIQHNTLCAIDWTSPGLEEEEPRYSREILIQRMMDQSSPTDNYILLNRTDIVKSSDTELMQYFQEMNTAWILILPFKGLYEHIGYMEIHASAAIQTPDRDILNIFSVVGNIISNSFERLRIYQNLQNETERLSVTLRSIGDGVITTDLDGNITLLNRVAEQLTGWSNKEAIGKALTDVFHLVDDNSGDDSRSPIHEVLQQGSVLEIIHRATLITRDGTERRIADSIAPIFNRESVIIGAVLVFRDISEQLKSEQEVIKMQKLESLGLLAGGLAHDFNNLLTGILGNISLAQGTLPNDSEANRTLKNAEDITIKAKDLVYQLLMFAKGGTPVRKITSIKSIVYEATNFVLHGSKSICKFDIQDDIRNVNIDTGQISQVLVNLVLNAQQAMPKGGLIHVKACNVSLDQSLGTLCPGDYVLINVTDSGVGIPRGIMEKIFDPYFTTKPNGTGLGLASAYSIIQQHQGLITVESVENVSTTFSIYLPATNQPTEVKNMETKTITPGQGRILVMDDEKLMRDLTKNVLTKYGYEVFTSADGREAVSQYKQQLDQGTPIDLVILDLTIPGGIGGLEAVKLLAEIDHNVVAIASSGYTNDPVMSNFRDYGFRGVLNKPFHVQQLVRLIQELLKKED